MKLKKRNQAVISAVLGILILLFSLISAVFFNYMSFEGIAQSLHVDTYRFVAVGGAQRMEYALNLGKTLDKYYGLGDQLEEIRSNSGNILAVSVRDDNRELITSVPAGVDMSSYTLNEGEPYLQGEGVVYTEYIFDGDKSIGLLLDTAQTDETVYGYLRQIAIVAAVILLVGIIAVIVATALTKGRLKSLKRVLIGVIILAQIALGIAVVQQYSVRYMSNLDGTAQIVSEVIEKDIKKITDAGIPVDEFVDFDIYLQDMAGEIDSFSTITNAQSTDNNPHYTVLGVDLSFGINEEVINANIFNFILDTVILIVATAFITLELLFFAGALSSGEQRDLITGRIRMMYFVIYAALSMGAAFVSVVALDMCTTLGQGSNNLLIGLPMTIEMLAGIMAIVISGMLLKQLGIRRTMMLSVLFCCAGLLLAGWGEHIWEFSLARALSGFGFSLATMVGRVYATSDKTDPGGVLANLTSVSILGFCSGAVLGGLLSDRLGYNAVFYISAICVLIALIFVKEMKLPIDEQKQFSAQGIFGIFKDRMAFGYLVLLTLPMNACAIVISYYVPLFGAQNGLSTTAISGIVLINSLLAAYLAPFTNALCAKLDSSGTQKSIYLYGAVLAIGIIAFTLFETVPMMILMSAVLGIADSFGLVVLITAFVRIPMVQKIGNVTGSVCSTLMGKSGQTLAPTGIALGGGTPIVLGAMVVLGMIANAFLQRSSNKVKV